MLFVSFYVPPPPLVRTGEEEQCWRKGVDAGRRRLLLPCRAGSEQAAIIRESFTQTLVAFSMVSKGKLDSLRLMNKTQMLKRLSPEVNSFF